MEYTNSDEFLSAYLDRELSPDERAAMDRYLEKSPEARLRLRELEQTSRLVREMPREALGLDFAGSVIDRLRNESALRQPPVEPVRRRTVRLSWWSAGPMAAAAAVLFAVWMTNRSIPENNLPALRPIAEPIASVSAVGRWQDLKVGDFFNVLGPEGDTPFQLIVVAKDSDENSVRCVMMDNAAKGERNLMREDGSTLAQTDRQALTLALQADHEQLDQLRQAYAQADAIALEPLAVVDIYAQADGLSVDEVRTHDHAMFADHHAQRRLVEEEQLKKMASRGLQAQRERRVPAGAAVSADDSDRVRTDAPNPPAEPDSKTAAGAEAIAADEQKRETAHLAELDSSRAAQPRFNQMQFKIERVQVNAPSAGERLRRTEAAKKTSESVRDMVKTDDTRSGLAGRNPKPEPAARSGRPEVLLMIKSRDSFDPEKPNR